MKRERKFAGLLIAVVVGVAACTEENITSVDVSQVSVTPPSVSTLLGEHVQFAATVRGDGEVFDAAGVIWSSEDERVVKVDEAGVARALGPGTTRVYASFRGVRGEAQVSVVSRGRGGGRGGGGGDDDDDKGGLLDGLLDHVLGG